MMNSADTAGAKHSTHQAVILTSVLLAFLSATTLTGTVFAADYCAIKAAQIVSVQGEVELRRIKNTTWQPARQNMHLCTGDMLRVRSHSRAAVRLNNDSLMRLDQRTTIAIPETGNENITSLIELIQGAIHILTRTPKPFKVKTPFLNAGVEGTEFFIHIESDRTRVVMFEGRLSAENKLGRVMLTDHEAAIAYRNQPPQKEIVVRPLDAVQWALYYPAIIGYQRNAHATGTDALLRQTERLLSVGRTKDARHMIDRILIDDPYNSNAIALQSIIALVQNQKERALELAGQAVEYDALSVPAWLALAYAQQASFDIDTAYASVKQATELDPDNALIWARLAELQMSRGQLKLALEAAQQAVALNPSLAKTQTVLGFAYLLQIDTHEAQSIFQHAITLDQADPMPRLGMGLALIREGRLEEGRIEIEIAASLDPGNSLIRSYLGKAYFEEKRFSRAETQFELAKTRDPFDPTPWFYDAIQKQTQNRPVEALQDIQKSIALNDNRAVYRSKFLLDQDQAARGSSLARIYDNLGFEKRAIMETARSLSLDPSNHSAHRFLSDSYVSQPRHEAARVSELLQAQLLQPINVNPVQPRLAVADLNIITQTGPSSAGFNEFTPLMDRNRSQLVASGFGGSHTTFGNEVVFSKLYDRTSISLGQFHYQTKGFRTNNDQNHDILNAFIQHAITPSLNIQAEARSRWTDHGNLLLDFDRDSKDPRSSQNRFRRNFDEQAVRVGARYKPRANHNLLLSVQYVDRKSNNIDAVLSPNNSIRNFEITSRNKGFQAEFQYQINGNNFNILAGSGIYNINVDRHLEINNLSSNQVICCTEQDFHIDKKNGYIYSNLNFNSNLNVTLGFSYDVYDERNYSINRFNPKIGVQWNLFSNLRLRFAWTETVKTQLTTKQTLEPTQVAGFNQLFDDINGTRSSRIGIGLDTHYANKIFGGIELSHRDLRVPLHSIANSNIQPENQNEKLYRAYFYSVLNRNWIVKNEIQYERFSRKETANGPHEIDTLSIPSGITYFNPNGFFANLTATYMRQKINRLSAKNEGIENFFLVDASLGYRLPNRTGVFTIEAKNIFDQSFLFRNRNFSAIEPTNTFAVPTRTIFARFTINF